MNKRGGERAQTARSYLNEVGSFYLCQADAPQPFTHAILDGGIGVLRSKESYDDLYAALSKDIVQFGGKISICERFPPIYGSWSRPDLVPPPHLIMRAARMYQTSFRSVPQGVFSERMVAGDVPVNRPKVVDWRESTFAMDLDYGSFEGEYDFNEIIQDVIMVQNCMKATQANLKARTCFVCTADTGGTLGVHLYYPFSCYYPEECLRLANYVACILALNRPLHMKNGRNWSDIVDLSIYDRTLRLPGVQKMQYCEACSGKTTIKSATTCQSCANGVVWKDRRYFPRTMLLPNGQRSEEAWMRAFTRFVDPSRLSTNQRKPPVRNPQKMKQSVEDRLKKHLTTPNATDEPIIETAEQAERWSILMLNLASIRITKANEHTRFLIPADMPRPDFPPAWIGFFDSVFDAALTGPATDATLRYGPYPAVIVRQQQPVTAVVAKTVPKTKRRPQIEEEPVPSTNDGDDDDENDDNPKRIKPAYDDEDDDDRKKSTDDDDRKKSTDDDNDDRKPTTDDEENEDGERKKLQTRSRPAAAIVPQPIDEKSTIRTVLRITTAPWSNPAGKEMTTMTAYLKQTKLAEANEKRNEIARSKLSHLLASTNDSVADAKLMITGAFSEFKTVDLIVTPANDPFKQVEYLQSYIRRYTHKNYQQLSVAKISHSAEYGNTMVIVRGIGMHFCMIAGRFHRKNSIFFIILKNGCELTQRCRHSKCKGHNYNWRQIKIPSVRVLFSPAETTIKDAASLQPEEQETAAGLLAASAGLAKKSIPTAKKLKGKPPPPRSIRNECDDAKLAGPSPIHKIAAGDVDENGQPAKPKNKKKLNKKKPTADDDPFPMSPMIPTAVLPVVDTTKPSEPVDIDADGRIVPLRKARKRKTISANQTMDAFVVRTDKRPKFMVLNEKRPVLNPTPMPIPTADPPVTPVAPVPPIRKQEGTVGRPQSFVSPPKPIIPFIRP